MQILRSNMSDSYWSVPQMIAYQSSAGHGIFTGDLVASGTISSKVRKPAGAIVVNHDCLHSVP